MTGTWPFLEYSDNLAKTSPKLIQNNYYKSNVFILYIKGATVDPKDPAGKPWTDRNVRRALMIGLDYNAINDALYGGKGAIHCWPLDYRASPFFTPLDELPAEAKMLYDYNPELATKMLRDAGVPEGFTFEVITPTIPEYAEFQDYVELAISMWEKLGIHGKMKIMDRAGRNAIRGVRKFPDLLSHRMTTASPYIHMLGGSTLVGDPHWRDPYYDPEYKKALATVDDDKRAQMMKDLAVYYLQEVPVIPGVHSPVVNGYWPWLQNYSGELESSYNNYKEMITLMWIDQKMKADMGFK